MINKILRAGYLIAGLSGVAAAVPNPIATLFRDNGSPANNLIQWNNISVDTTTLSPAPPEGQRSIRTVATSWGGGWGLVYLQPDQVTRRTEDYSAYAAHGELRFWAWCDTDNFDIFLEHADMSKEHWTFAGSFGSQLNQWTLVAIPLNTIAINPATGLPYPINDIYSPFEINMNQAGTCYIDDIRFVNPPAPNAELFSVAVKNVSDQAGASQLSWPAGLAPQGWVAADQYLELHIDRVDAGAWGVQIYTDNRRAGASPTYQVFGSSNPAGLVNVNDPRLTIPMAWAVTASTNTPSVAQPAPADPTAFPANPMGFPWLVMKDLQTPDIPSENTTAFQNADPYSVTVNNHGIHFGQNDAAGNPNFGAAWALHYLFLEANFNRAPAQQTYQTNTLTLEYFNY